LKMHCNITFPSAPRSSSGVFPSGFCTATLYARACRVSRTAHPPRFHHPNNFGMADSRKWRQFL